MRTILIALLFPLFSTAQVSMIKPEPLDPVYVGPYVKGSVVSFLKGGKDPLFSYHAGLTTWYMGHTVDVGFIHESDGFSGFETNLAFRIWGMGLGSGFDMSYVLGTNFSFLSRSGSTKTNSSTGLRVRWSKTFNEKWLIIGEIPINARFTDHSERGREILGEYGLTFSVRYFLNTKKRKGK